jgi:hypothetical protein
MMSVQGDSGARRFAVKRGALLFLAVVSLAWTPPAPTKVEGCRVDGLLPDRACTPGAVATTDLDAICHTSTRGRRVVARDARRRVFAAYGIAPHQPPGAYEMDHLVPLELGGSNAIANLWPEAAPGFHDKDQVENTLHARVCSGAMNIDEAQRAIAADWRTAGTR